VDLGATGTRMPQVTLVQDQDVTAAGSVGSLVGGLRAAFAVCSGPISLAHPRLTAAQTGKRLATETSPVIAEVARV
jgi:hypothetical protein